MNYTFYDGHDELYRHAKFREDRTMRAGCMCENVVFDFCLFVTGRMPRSGKLPVLNLLTGQKSGFSPRRATRCTDSRQTWQDRRAPGSAWLCNISPQSPQRGGNAAQKIRNVHFFVKNCPAGATPLTDFEIF